MKLVSSGSTRKKSGKRASKRKKKNGSGVKALCAVLIVALIGFVAYTLYGSVNHTGVLPNVYAYGVELGGLSQTEAEAAIIRELETTVVTVSFPGGSAMELSRADTVKDYDPAAAADEAYAYGRNGDRPSPLRYAFSLAGKVELRPGAFDAINGEALRAAIAKKAAVINSAQVEGAYSVSGSTLTIVKGVSGVMLDEDEVYRIAREAFEQGFAGNSFEGGAASVQYVPPETAPRPISIEDIYSMVCREPVDARFDAEFNIQKSMDGLRFNIDEAQSLYDAAEDGAVISITLRSVRPEVSTEELEALLYRDLLAEWTSDLTNNETRSMNIELAAKSVNGTILLPGEEFSYNDVVGERTKDRGFGAAAAYANGQTVYEVGGGICQVSSAIYYCCLIADMDILSRTCHLYTASYVPLGMDATVSWGGPEFEFANSSEYPVKIVTWREGDKLYCELYGTKTSDEYIEMEYEINEIKSYDTVYKEDESVAPGHTKTGTYGITGYKVTSYKLRYAADGTLISRDKEDVSIYSKRDQVILVAPGELHIYAPEATPPGQSAEPSPEITPEATPEPEITPVPTPEPTPEPTPDEGSPTDMIWDDFV